MNVIKGSPHGAYRKTATIVGVLYIIGTVAGVLSLVFAGSMLGDPDYLLKISANENQFIMGAFCVLTMGLALAMIPAVMFPILQKHHGGLAVGYVVFRGALETFCYIAMAAGWLLLISLSQEYVEARSVEAFYFQTLSALVLKGNDVIRSVLEIVFPMGALMFYTVLYQSGLIPRWLSFWGLIGAILYLAAGLFAMFNLDLGVLLAPLALQEMVMAVWLIVKGFNPSPIIENAESVQLFMSQA
jgi:hypothetical protein